MRKRIITALGLILSVFIGEAIYIIITIEVSRTNLNTLTTLHQVQLMRDDLLIYLERSLSKRHQICPFSKGYDK